jgi:hypothetical protein
VDGSTCSRFRDRWLARCGATCSLLRAVPIVPFARPEPLIKPGPRVRQIDGSRKLRTVPGSQVRPPRPDRTRANVRRRPPNTQPRIITLNATVLPAPSARRTGVLGGAITAMDSGFAQLAQIEALVSTSSERSRT